MALHRMNSITIGVPDVEKTSEFYRDFGFTESEPGVFATADGGEQLRLVHTPIRRLVELAIGADDPDDVDRVASNVNALGVEVKRTEDGLTAIDPGTDVRVRVEVAPRLRQEPIAQAPYNGVGRTDRLGRAPKLRPTEDQVQARPRKLGHVVIGTTDLEPSKKFFMEGIGFKLSDQMMDRAFFLRCSEDHHNLLLQQAPVKFLHHSSWQVEDVDEIGLGAQYLLSKGPGAAHLGARPAPRRLQLLLVLPRPGRQLRRVLLRHGLHPRRPDVGAAGLGGHALAVLLGPAATAVLPAPGRPGRADGGPALAEGIAMRLVTYTHGGSTLVGAIAANGDVVDLTVAGLPTTMLELLAMPDGLTLARKALESATVTIPIADVQLRAPVPRPGKVLAIGLNYRDHAEESGQPIPQRPGRLREGLDVHRRARRRDPHPARQPRRRLGSGAVLRHREDGALREGGGRGAVRRRLHDRQRRLGARLAVPLADLDDGQVVRHARADRAVSGHAG